MDAFQEKKGLIILTLSLGDKEISTSQRPLISSNCATELSFSYEGNVLMVRYNSDNCYADDENYYQGIVDANFILGVINLEDLTFTPNLECQY